MIKRLETIWRKKKMKPKNNKEKTKRSWHFNIWRALTTLIFIIVVLFAITALMSKFSIGGVKLFTVQSGSMEPTIKTGSMILTKSEKNYEIGDIITFEDAQNRKQTVTHRIVGKQTEGTLSYTTEGDANGSPDSQVTMPYQIIGKVLLKIPYFGYPVAFARTPVGFSILVIVPATIIIYEEINNLKNEIIIWRGKKKEGKDAKKKLAKKKQTK